MASVAIKSKYGKKYREALKNLDQEKFYNLNEAVKALVDNKVAKFNETIDIVLKLGVDTKHSDQMVRGVISMPNGIGKTVRVAVFARDAKADEARKAGAEIVGAEDLVQAITNGEINFDVCIATPDMMGVVGRVAKVLGPKGMMPNPKLGTVTADVTKAVAIVKAGQVEFRAEKEGIVHAGLGKVNFSTEALIENIKVFVDAVIKAKPTGAKGKYLREAFLSTTMGPSVKIDLVSLETNIT